MATKGYHPCNKEDEREKGKIRGGAIYIEQALNNLYSNKKEEEGALEEDHVNGIGVKPLLVGL